jgi:hypothetical protein
VSVDQEELLNKLAQIEEQASYTLAEFPKTLTKERLRMIVALARYLKTEISLNPNNIAQNDTRVGDNDESLAA